jgi:hypothetical protein
MRPAGVDHPAGKFALASSHEWEHNKNDGGIPEPWSDARAGGFGISRSRNMAFRDLEVAILAIGRQP